MIQTNGYYKISVAVIKNYSAFSLHSLTDCSRNILPDGRNRRERNVQVSKMNFAVSRSILNKSFETILDIPFADVIVLRDKYHKPYIKNQNGIKFNISHTDGYVVIGFSKRELGIDIEKVNYDFEFEDILENCFTFREINNIGLDAAMFYKYWTAKEAYLKYEGYGLIRSPKEIEVIHIDDQIIKIEDKIKRTNKDLIALNLSSGKYFGAICI